MHAFKETRVNKQIPLSEFSLFLLERVAFFEKKKRTSFDLFVRVCGKRVLGEREE